MKTKKVYQESAVSKKSAYEVDFQRFTNIPQKICVANVNNYKKIWKKISAVIKTED